MRVAIWGRVTMMSVVAVVGATTGAAAQTTAKATESQVTFTKDVAPILQRSCQTCHRPNNIAPMSLLTYEDARPWARSIRSRVAEREMPPWYIDRNVGVKKFDPDPSLSDAEIATIVKWVDAGAPRGNQADMPPPRQFDDNDRWHIGTPDIVASLPKDIIVKAAAPDQWIDVDMTNVDIPEDRFIKAVEVKPSKGVRWSTTRWPAPTSKRIPRSPRRCWSSTRSASTATSILTAPPASCAATASSR